MSDRDRRPRSRSRDRYSSGGSDSRGNSYQTQRQEYSDRRSLGGGRFERRDGGRGQNFGRGGRDHSGRFDSRGGGGGRGRGHPGGGGGGGLNLNMGSLQSIEQIIRHHSDMSDEAILRITHPPYSERDRSDYIVDQTAHNKPRLDAWRVQQRVGVEINRNVRANFFKLNPRLLPPCIFHYNIAIYRYKQGEIVMDVDLTKESDSAVNTAVMKAFIHSQPTLRHSAIDGNPIFLIYDGKSSVYSVTMIEGMMVQGDVTLSEQQGGQTFHIILVPVVTNNEALIIPNSATSTSWATGRNSQSILQALDIAALSFARWQHGDTHPTWLFSGNKAFKSDGQSFTFDNMQAMLGRLGYFASVRCTASGPVLIADVSYTCFLKGGLLPNLLALIGNYDGNNKGALDEFYRMNLHAFDDPETSPLCLKAMDVMSNIKIRLTHINHTKRLKKFSYPADDIRTRFLYDDKHMVTVAEYFALKSQTDSRYFILKYPHLPTVMIGKNKVDNNPILVPMEVVFVCEGQVRNKPPLQVASELIRYAAMKPTQRFALLTNQGSDGLLGTIQQDDITASFGLHGIQSQPMQIKATILPPPRLQYAQQRTVEPGLKGSWQIGNNQFAVSPPMLAGERGGRVFGYALLITITNPRGGSNAVNQQDLMRIEEFQRTIENDSRRLGTPLQECARYAVVPGNDMIAMQTICRQLKHQNKARLVITILQNDSSYGHVKSICDSMQLPSQCARWKNVVQKIPSGYHTSLMIKIQHKLGGVGHTLAPRFVRNRSKQEEDDEEESFEQPPKSISWLFEEPCMVMGVDVSHPNDGHGNISNNAAGDSVAAVVGSMDGMLGQYCAHISRCTISNTEPVPHLEVAMDSLLNAFARRNHGKIPKHIIIYRDGVADNQFEQVLETEIRAYREAIFMRGIDPASVKIAVVMCQKRHHTRIVYEANANEGGGFVNPAVGLCVDGRDFVLDPSLAAASSNDDPDGLGSINTPNMNEFYLNSHAAILGTAKPCKYTLIYDEIGLKLTEIELLTYWMTHLYCRCTKSVSYATPAYYAHWAARRGKVLLAAGMTGVELQELSEKWMEDGVPASMYFA